MSATSPRRGMPAIATACVLSLACGDGGGSGTEGTGSADDSSSGEDDGGTQDGADSASTQTGPGEDGDTSGPGTTSGDAGTDTGSTGDTGVLPPTGTPYVFVGAGSDVYAYVMDPADGSLTAAGSQDVGNVDFMSVGPDHRTVLIANSNSVSAFKFDESMEIFTSIDSANTVGGTHVMADPTGMFVFTASYGDAELGFHTYSEANGFGMAEVFMPGANAHQVRVSSSGTKVYVPCLGVDHVAQYDLDPGAGTLTFDANASLGNGSGPRHMDFHPTADVAYVLAELSSEIYVFDIDGSGNLIARPGDTVFTHDDGMFHQSSDIKVTPDGAFVYAVNRVAPEIVRFRVEADHAVTKLGADPLTGAVRSFGMDPAGTYIHAGGDDGRLAALRIDPATGALTETSAETGLGNIRATEIRYLD